MKISIIIPAFNAECFMSKLLMSIEQQTLQPEEAIVVDSSRSSKTESIVRNWQGRIPVVYKKLDFAYPGHARNVGVGLARGDMIAFLDCRTIPNSDWLERCTQVMLQNEADLVSGLFVGTFDSDFKQIVSAATYGNIPVSSLPGSLIAKSVFVATGGFISDIRAGEDIEWRGRLVTTGVKIAYPDSPVIIYEGFPVTLFAAIRKWYEYSFSNASIDVVNTQKIAYSVVLVSISLLLAYKWNYLFADWKEDSLFYVPNITKLTLAAMFFCYIVFRGVIRPYRRKVPLTFLLPWRWLQVTYVGLCLDLAKAPGLLLGTALLAWRTLLSFMSKIGLR